MADVTIIRPGTWGLTRPVSDGGGGWTTFATEQRLAPSIQMFWPPIRNGAPIINAVLVCLNGPVTQPPDGNTVLFPLPITADVDPLFGDLSNPQRNSLRSGMSTFMADYTFTDYDGTVTTKSGFSVKAAGWNNSTPLSQLVV